MDRVADDVLGPGVLDHPHRPVARLPGNVEPAGLRLRAGARPDLPRPGGPVREFPRPARHSLYRAAGPGGGDAVPLVLQPNDQHLQPDRHGDADRAGGEEWHSHRRVCEPTQGRGPVNPGGDRRGGGGALPAHPHDRPLHDPWRAADCAGTGGGGGEPHPDGSGCDWRAPCGHLSLALRYPCHVHLPHERGRRPCTGGRRRGRWGWAARRGGGDPAADGVVDGVPLTCCGQIGTRSRNRRNTMSATHITRYTSHDPRP